LRASRLSNSAPTANADEIQFIAGVFGVQMHELMLYYCEIMLYTGAGKNLHVKFGDDGGIFTISKKIMI